MQQILQYYTCIVIEKPILFKSAKMGKNISDNQEKFRRWEVMDKANDGA